MTMKGGVYLTVDRQASDGITRTAGGIINTDNNESNYVDWIVKNGGVNDYIIPWLSTDLSYIPFTFHIGTVGTNDGRLLFSTWRTSTLNTAIGMTGYPNSVTNLNSASTGLDNSYNCVDRFWWARYSGYATPPTGTMTFYYTAPLELQAPNTIASESNLQAQYWDGIEWVLPPTGTDNTTNHYVSGVSTKSFDAPWVLVSNTSPLPVEFSSPFKAKCDGDNVDLSWSTASETSNDYFTIEKTMDDVQWIIIATVQGAGNNNQPIDYHYTDKNLSNSTVYYRLDQTDYDGTKTTTAPVPVKCDDIDLFYVYPNPVSNTLYISIGENVLSEVKLFNITGQLIYSGKEKLIDMSTYSVGIYSLQVVTDLGYVFNSKVIKK